MIEQKNPTTNFDISKLGLPIMTPIPLNQYYDISYDNKTLSVHFIYYSISKTNFTKYQSISSWDMYNAMKFYSKWGAYNGEK
jgi:hypothetical protein